MWHYENVLWKSDYFVVLYGIYSEYTNVVMYMYVKMDENNSDVLRWAGNYHVCDFVAITVTSMITVDYPNFYHYAIGTTYALYFYRDSAELSNRFLECRLAKSIYRDKQVKRAMVAFCFKVVIWKCTLEVIIFCCSLCTYKCFVNKTWKWTK